MKLYGTFRLLIKASGAGDYWGEYEGVRCKVYFKGVPYQKEDDDRTYLGVESVKMDFSVKDITMGVENDNNNRVIRKFTSWEFRWIVNGVLRGPNNSKEMKSLESLRGSGEVSELSFSFSAIIKLRSDFEKHFQCLWW